MRDDITDSFIFD